MSLIGSAMGSLMPGTSQARLLLRTFWFCWLGEPCMFWSTMDGFAYCVLPPGGRQITLAAMPPSETDLMVSLEPPGGSPTGAPTGPVVYAGKLRHLRP